MTIKHIVISGGGPPGLITYGVLKSLSKHKYWNISNIKSVYGTSMGSVVSIVILLDYCWEWMDDFFIKRPWNKLIDIPPEVLFNINNERGVITEDIIRDILAPLFQGKDLEKDVTMKQLYDYTKIDFHIFSTNMNSSVLEKVDISHLNYPDLPVYKAVYMSGSIPGICSPISNQYGCFIDGGYLNNFPIKDCLENEGANDDEILGVLLQSVYINNITDDSSLVDVYFGIMLKLVDYINKDQSVNIDSLKNIVCCSPIENNGILDWWNLLYESELRTEFIEKGNKDAVEFLERIKFNIEEDITDDKEDINTLCD